MTKACAIYVYLEYNSCNISMLFSLVSYSSKYTKMPDRQNLNQQPSTLSYLLARMSVLLRFPVDVAYRKTSLTQFFDILRLAYFCTLM